MISGSITIPNETLAIKGIQAIDARVMRGARQGLSDGLKLVASIAQEEFMTGPRPQHLGVVTSLLRGSITTKVDGDDNVSRGSIGTNVIYGAKHEFGSDRLEEVKGYTRATHVAGLQKIREVRSRKDGSIKRQSPLYKFDNAGNIIGYKTTLRALAAKHGMLEQTQFESVKPHTRQMKYAGKPFIRPALAKGMPLVLAEINKGISNAKS